MAIKVDFSKVVASTGAQPDFSKTEELKRLKTEEGVLGERERKAHRKCNDVKAIQEKLKSFLSYFKGVAELANDPENAAFLYSKRFESGIEVTFLKSEENVPSLLENMKFDYKQNLASHFPPVRHAKNFKNDVQKNTEDWYEKYKKELRDSGPEKFPYNDLLEQMAFYNALAGAKICHNLGKVMDAGTAKYVTMVSSLSHSLCYEDVPSGTIDKKTGQTARKLVAAWEHFFLRKLAESIGSPISEPNADYLSLKTQIVERPDVHIRPPEELTDLLDRLCAHYDEKVPVLEAQHEETLRVLEETRGKIQDLEKELLLPSETKPVLPDLTPET